MNNDLSPIAQKVVALLSDTYGVDPEDLTLTTDIVEDVDMKSDPESMARFVQSTNQEFDIQVRLTEISDMIDDEEIVCVQDLVNLVEDAMLE